LLELEEVAVEGSNYTICSLPGKCMTQKRLIKIKNLIKEMLNDFVKTSTEPDMEQIYKRLKDELDVDAHTADELIEVSRIQQTVFSPLAIRFG